MSEVPPRVPTSVAVAQLTVLLVAVVLGMSPWFSATVVAPLLIAEWGGDGRDVVTRGTWLTLAVQLGFVAGSTVSAAFLLSDRLRPKRLAAWSAALAAVATASLVLPGVREPHAIVLRVFVGAALAGVYPPAIKIAAGWTRARRGTAIGALVGGTTLGSAVPHLLRLVVDPSTWRVLVLIAAGCAAAGSILFAVVVREGPFQAPSAPFNPRALGALARNRGVRLATVGYLGHMWELYAMWSTIGIFWIAAAAQFGAAAWVAPVAAFASVAAGAVGCVVAGRAADIVGRSIVTVVAMAVSGACALLIGPALHGGLPVVLLVSVLWGTSIVADSAQFSAAVTEYSLADYVGTAVTIQTALGFLLTTVTIRLVPTWSAWWGWEYAYAPLALGPAVGIAAMWRLRTLERRLGERSASPSTWLAQLPRE